MGETLLSVGIDLGTSTTQMIVSRLQMQNTAAAFTVPHMEITEREILYRSPIHFTPLLSADTLDATAIQEIIRQEYRKAGIVPQEIKTGAVIITGETARKENSRQVLEALKDLAGEFVVATAGPALESVLAARGAGADHCAEKNLCHVLHMDIGGGTANLALYDPTGTLADTGCLNVGGRLIKLDEHACVTYVSPVLRNTTDIRVGETVSPARLQPVIDRLVQALEEAAGLREQTDCLFDLITDKTVRLPEAPLLVSFSGGVADLIERQEHWLCYGDIGVLLGRSIRQSKLCQGRYVLGAETIRATVVGAGSHATELSGSTVFYTDVTFPLQNLPVLTVSPQEEAANHLSQLLAEKLRLYEPTEPVALFLEGNARSYAALTHLAKSIVRGAASLLQQSLPLVVTTKQDLAKALGQAMKLLLPANTKLVCLDGLQIPEGSYLDIAAPVAGGAALPVVIKTLAFETNSGR